MRHGHLHVNFSTHLKCLVSKTLQNLVFMYVTLTLLVMLLSHFSLSIVKLRFVNFYTNKQI